MAELSPDQRRALDEALGTAHAALEEKWAAQAPEVPERRETYVMEFNCTWSELESIRLAVKGFCIGRKRCYLKRREDGR